MPAGVKGTPLGKILRQLRIDRDEFALCPQKGSRVAFGPAGETALRFTNDFAVLESEVAAHFPGAGRRVPRRSPGSCARRPCRAARLEPPPARSCGGSIDDPLLEDMLLCPLMFYGSAREDDMDLGQFAIMFRALYLEGLRRPLEGVRVMMRVLLEKYRAAGGERRMKCGVKKHRRPRRAGRRRSILDSGEEIDGRPRCSPPSARRRPGALLGETPAEPPARSGYVETISVLDRQPADLGWGDDTIVFFNDSDRFTYRRPAGPGRPAKRDHLLPEQLRVRRRAGSCRRGSSGSPASRNYESWAGLPEEPYRATRRAGSARSRSPRGGSCPRSVRRTPSRAATVATDMFTPTTVEQFTGHLPGRDLRRAGQEPGGPDGPLESLSLRHRPGHARHRRARC